MTTHRPSGSMCAACVKRDSNCSHLPFGDMRAIRKDDDGTVVVKCFHYTKREVEHDKG